MSYLLAKYTLIFLLTALFSFLLGWWWSRRHFVDVSESYEKMMRSQQENDGMWLRLWDRFDNHEKNLTANFTDQINTLPKPKELDLSEINEQLSNIKTAINAIPVPEQVDLSALETQVDSLGMAVNSLKIPEPEQIDLSPMHQGLDRLETKISNIKIPEPEKIDLSTIENRLGAVESELIALEIPPAVSLSQVEKSLSTLQQQVDKIKIPQAQDLTGIISQLNTIDEDVRNIRIPEPSTIDISHIEESLSAIDARLSQLPKTTPEFDLSPMNEKLQRIQQAIDSLPEPAKPQPVDLSLMAKQKELELLSSRISTKEDINHVGKLISSISIPAAPDINAIELKLKHIESKLDALKASQTTVVKTIAAPAPKPAPEGPRLFTRAEYGKKDDLKRISGVGPKLEKLLNKHGVYYFWQVASWNKKDVQFIDDRLEVFKGRIERDDWVSQAKRLQGEPGSAKAPT